MRRRRRAGVPVGQKRRGAAHRQDGRQNRNARRAPRRAPRRHAAHAAPLLRDAHARERRAAQGRSGPSGPRQHRRDAALSEDNAVAD